MKIIETNRFVDNNTAFKTKTFGIKSKNLTHIISIIRDQIYSDKILAVIREYSCNAQDANVMNGKNSTPIVVTLPSKLSPEFKVRDFGAGLSEQDIEDIFISYGESTKRNTNDAIGTLGIGSKCGFAYGDNFIVTSYNNGIKTVYDCILDKSNVGNCLVLCSEPMSKNDKEGVEITVNVKKDDVDDFRSKALEFFKYWTIKPELVGFSKDELVSKESKVLFSGSNWTIFETGANRGYYNSDKSSLALMGNIAYPINWETVRLPKKNDKTEDDIDNVVLEYLKGSKLLIRFNIGDLQFAPSREALQYTDYTNNGIADAVNVIMSEIEKVITDKFVGCKNLWEAHLLFAELFGHGTYGYGGMSQLRSYFTKKGLKWNGITIDSSDIDGFYKYDLVKGYKVDGHNSTNYGKVEGTFPISRYSMNGSMMKCRKGTQYENAEVNSMRCSVNTMVMLYDVTKHNYVRKACSYLMGKNAGIQCVYVLDFKGNKALQDLCFKNMNLNLVPMVKYSDIMEDVRTSIVRVNGRVRSIVNKDSTSRHAKFVVVANNTYDNSYRRRNRSYECWNQVDVDFANESGHYVELNNNELKWSGKDDKIGNIQNVCNVVELLNKSGMTKIEKIYGFGSRVLESKVFDKTKWIRIETVVSEKLDELVQDNGFKWYAAFKKVETKYRDGNKMPSLSLVKRLSNKITQTDNPFIKLSELVKNQKADKVETYDSLITKVGSKVKCDVEMDSIDTLVKMIINQYPMLVLTNSYRSHYNSDEAFKATEITTISNYINQVDSLNNQ